MHAGVADVADTSPLDSPTIGTAPNDLIQPCTVKDPQPARPPDPDVLPAFSMAFSGGGFRATLAALGVVRFMADAGLLDRVRWVSSVSGGSVAHGLLARDYAELRTTGFSREAVDRLVISPFVQAISTTSLTSELLRNLWRAMGSLTRTDLLADAFDRWFYRGLLLEQLPEGCRFIFNASSVTTGVRFGFERDVVGDWVIGRAATAGSGIRMSQAVAASAAVPGRVRAVRGQERVLPVLGRGRAQAPGRRCVRQHGARAARGPSATCASSP